MSVPSTTATASAGTSSESPHPAATSVSTARAAAAKVSERFIETSCRRRAVTGRLWRVRKCSGLMHGRIARAQAARRAATIAAASPSAPSRPSVRSATSCRADVYTAVSASRPQRPELGRREADRPDRRAPAPEDEVVRADERQRELRLLDAEQVLHGLREAARSGPRSPRAAPAARPRARRARSDGGGRSSAPRPGCRSRGRTRRRGRRPVPGRTASRAWPGELGDGLVRASRRRARSRAPRRGPDCSAPSRSPAPRISRSRIAIWKPAPSSVWSASVARRARASAVSSLASG